MLSGWRGSQRLELSSRAFPLRREIFDLSIRLIQLALKIRRFGSVRIR